MSSSNSNKNVKKKARKDMWKEISDMREEIQIHDAMLNSLVDLLEERGMVSNKDWETKIKERLSSR